MKANFFTLQVVLVMYCLYHNIRETKSQANQAACALAGIVFETHQIPKIYVAEGASAFISCNFTMEGEVRPLKPFWRVDSQGVTKFFYPGLFPNGIEYNQSARGLIIDEVGKDMNGALVTCCFEFFDIRDICENEATQIKVLSVQQANGETGLKYSLNLIFVVLALLLVQVGYYTEHKYFYA